jgi:hypothetical protein
LDANFVFAVLLLIFLTFVDVVFVAVPGATVVADDDDIFFFLGFVAKNIF